MFLLWEAWRTTLNWTGSALVIHALDLLIFIGFMFLALAPAGHFFSLFAFFLLVSATLRWHWRGTIYTAAIVFGIGITKALYMIDLPLGAKLDIDHLICDTIFLLVAAILLGYLGVKEERQRSKISELAAWPRTIPEEIYPLVSGILQRSSSLLDAPRTLLLWNEGEEPRLHAASWSQGQFNHSIESSDTFGSLVAEPMAGKNFLCRDSLARVPLVLHSSPGGFEEWKGLPLDPELQRRFSIKSVLSFALQSESVSGRLFALDKEYMTSDDLVFGRIISHEASCNLDQFYLLEQLKQKTAMEERISLSRDLHDGLLQSLTGTVMQLDTVRQLIEKEPQTARQRLLDIQKQISGEGQNLRSHIRQLKSHYSSLPEWDGDHLARRLDELAEHIERQWGLLVDIDVNLHQTRLSGTMAQGVYLITHESMINAARHSKASSIKAEISSTDHQLQILVTDNGHGFPFNGRYDHAALTKTNLGPVVLRERVTSLGGQLTIESGQAGARLEITLPIPEEMR
ncbi:MAG: hypothetical protein KKF00_09110 [Proteobacteria bacterium]|nr:hypothetical protein [Pseudomonadota bacterium]MBU1398541.1 hypothetical protein [Pseudomonadota bacterium]